MNFKPLLCLLPFLCFTQPALAQYKPICDSVSLGSVELKRLPSQAVLCRGDRSKYDNLIYIVSPDTSNVGLLLNADGTRLISIGYVTSRDPLKIEITQFYLDGRKFLRWERNANAEILTRFRPQIKILLDYVEFQEIEF